MRIRHEGIQPFWATVTTIDVDTVCPPELAAHTWTRAAACLWWWRVKKWKFSGSVSWDILGNSGSGTFDNVILEADGALRFEDQRTGDEKDLLHRLCFANSVLYTGTGTGDLQSASINLTIGDTNTFRYLNPEKVPAWTTREFRPDTFTFGVGILDTDDAEIGATSGEDYEFGDGSPDAPFFLRVNLGDAPEFIAGEVFATPYEWYPYKDHAEASPIWDSATGAQIIDPRNDSQNWPN